MTSAMNQIFRRGVGGYSRWSIKDSLAVMVNGKYLHGDFSRRQCKVIHIFQCVNSSCNLESTGIKPINLLPQSELLISNLLELLVLISN